MATLFFSAFVREHLGFQPTYADANVYRKPIVKANGDTYYAYLIIYVDDILCIEENPKVAMDQIESLFRLKDGVSSPNMYLGTDTRKWVVYNENGMEIPCCVLDQKVISKKPSEQLKQMLPNSGYHIHQNEKRG